MSKKEFQRAMHAFSSLISLEQVYCDIDSKTTGCQITNEKGWQPLEYLHYHHSLLSNIYSRLRKSTFKTFVREQIEVLQHAIFYYQHPYIPHGLLVKKIIPRVGQKTLYPFGTRDHQVYAILKHVSHRKYTAVFFDLGAGRSGEVIRDNFKPIVRKFKRAKDFYQYVNDILWYNQDKPSSISLFNKIYGEDRRTCKACVPGRPQTTGNCVVKNLLAAMRQSAIDSFGKRRGRDFFQRLYLLLIKETLCDAMPHAKLLRTPLPLLSKVCAHIQSSQQAFTGISCRRIVTEIEEPYSRLSSHLIYRRPQEHHHLSALWRQSHCQHPVAQADDSAHNEKLTSYSR